MYHSRRKDKKAIEENHDSATPGEGEDELEVLKKKNEELNFKVDELDSALNTVRERECKLDRKIEKQKQKLNFKDDKIAQLEAKL